MLPLLQSHCPLSLLRAHRTPSGIKRSHSLCLEGFPLPPWLVLSRPWVLPPWSSLPTRARWRRSLPLHLCCLPLRPCPVAVWLCCFGYLSSLHNVKALRGYLEGPCLLLCSVPGSGRASCKVFEETKWVSRAPAAPGDHLASARCSQVFPEQILQCGLLVDLG